MKVQVDIQFEALTAENETSLRSVALQLTNNRGSVRVFALEDRTNWLRAEFTMPTEAQYKAVAKIDGAIRFALWNRLDSIIRFPKPEQERRESRSKTSRRRQS